MQKRRVRELEAKKAPQNEEQKKSNKIFKIVLVLFSLVLILFLIQPFAKGMKTFFKNTAKSTVKVLSRTVGTPMVKDTF
jgi:Na+/H+ antiporter NhaD/arsenite permease-like protein